MYDRVIVEGCTDTEMLIESKPSTALTGYCLIFITPLQSPGPPHLFMGDLYVSARSHSGQRVCVKMRVGHHSQRDSIFQSLL